MMNIEKEDTRLEMRRKNGHVIWNAPGLIGPHVFAILISLIGIPLLLQPEGVALGLVLMSTATFVAVIVGPSPSVRLTNRSLSGAGNVVPRHTIRDISMEKMENFTHVYAETSQGRFCVWSHRDATRCATLVVQLKRELDRIQRLQGSPDDIPAALSGLRAAVTRKAAGADAGFGARRR